MHKAAFNFILAAALLLAPVAARAQLDDAGVNEAGSAIMDAGKMAAQIRALRDVPSLGVIVIDRGFASPFSHIGNEVSRLQIYEERFAPGIHRLRQALAANPVTRRALASHGVNIAHVVGVEIGSSGSLRVFAD
ncbi:MAG: hypothetical protein KGO53_14565 [Alphaproteobacteria bacterium]|nr:hypothetical protein [Alphaproteobacteria bacterium]